MSHAPRLSVVVPTLNEAQGIETFLQRLVPVVRRLDAEILVIDDASQDETVSLARALLSEADQVVVRRGPRSLALSVVEGWGLARAPVLAVIDADLSHPPELLSDLLAAVEGGADVAVATRYMPGGGTPGWPIGRQIASRFASILARSLVRARDPLSGYLVLRREVLEGAQLDPRGWKIGLEVLSRCKWQRLAEVPYLFQDRVDGVSKFGRKAVWDYFRHLGRLHRARWTK